MHRDYLQICVTLAKARKELKEKERELAEAQGSGTENVGTLLGEE